MQVHIKNMACESCKVVVKQALDELGIIAINIKLGEIETEIELTNDEKNKLNIKIKKFGLEVIEKKNGILVDKIKLAIVNYVYHTDDKPTIALSVFLSAELKHNYGYLANAFSEFEGKTIKQFLAAMRVERIKELISEEAETLTQIAFKLRYSSVAHLSKHFKNTTGLTISQFKALKDKRRMSIQEL